MGVGDFNLIISHKHKQQPRDSTTGLWVSSTKDGFAVISTLDRRVGDSSLKTKILSVNQLETRFIVDGYPASMLTVQPMCEV